MYKAKRWIQAVITLFVLLASSTLLLLFRYVLKTPQPLASDIPGEAHIYRWTHASIFYKVSGMSDKPPLLLLHAPEIGASAHEMRGIVEGLAPYYRVYTPDLPGFGLSDHPNMNYSAITYVEFCHDFLQEVIGQPALLFASGASCNYSVAVAAEHPHLCSGLILISPVSLFSHERCPGWLVQLAKHRVTGLLLYSLLTSRFVLRYVVGSQHMLASEYVSSADLDYPFAAAHQFGAHYAPLAFIAGRLDLRTTLPTGYARPIDQPVLLLWGTHALHSVRMAAHVPGIPSSAHVVVIDEINARVHEATPIYVIHHIRQWQNALGTSARPSLPANYGTGARPASFEEPGPERATDENRVPLTPIADALISPHSGQANGRLPRSNGFMKTLPPEPEEPASPTAPGESPEPGGPPASQQRGEEDRGEGAREQNPESEQNIQIEAYCVRCRQKRAVQHARRIVTRNGRNAIEGTCPVCNAKLFRFVAR